MTRPLWTRMACMPRALLRLVAASVLAGLVFAGLPFLTDAAGAAPARAVFLLGDLVKHAIRIGNLGKGDRQVVNLPSLMLCLIRPMDSPQ